MRSIQSCFHAGKRYRQNNCGMFIAALSRILYPRLRGLYHERRTCTHFLVLRKPSFNHSFSFTHPFVHLLNIVYLFYVAGTVLGAGDLAKSHLQQITELFHLLESTLMLRQEMVGFMLLLLWEAI